METQELQDTLKGTKFIISKGDIRTHARKRARTRYRSGEPAGCLCQPNACSRLLTLKCFCECLLTLHKNAVFAIRTLQN